MKFNKDIIKKAHEMAREIKKEYQEVDYRLQFGLCLSYLLNNKEDATVDIKLMETERLLQLKKEIEKELQGRNDLKKEVKKVIVTHDCYGRSGYHFTKYKHWIKKITEIDDSKTNGYAFKGEFLQTKSQNLIEVGSYVVEVCGVTLILYKIVDDVENENKELICTGNYRSFLSFIQDCKEAIE